MRQNNRIVGSVGVDLVDGQLQENEFGYQEFPKVVQIKKFLGRRSQRKYALSSPHFCLHSFRFASSFEPY